MNATNLSLAAQLVPETYVRQAADAIASRENNVKVLLSQVRRICVRSSRRGAPLPC